MACFVVSKVLDVFQCIAPFVGNQFHVDSSGIHFCGQTFQCQHLRFPLFCVHRAFNAKLERSGSFHQCFNVIGHRLVVVYAERHTDGAVNVNMQDRGVVFGVAELQDPVTEPFHIVQQNFAVTAQLGVHIIDQCVRQNVCAFHDHLVGVVVTVVAGLGKDRNLSVFRVKSVFFGDHFTHQLLFGFGNGIQNRLGYAVTDCGVKTFAVNLDGFHRRAHVAEVCDLVACQRWSHVLFDDRNEIFCQEQRITAACSGVLHGSTVAVCDLAVFENQHDGDGFSGLTDCFKSFGYRLAYVCGTVCLGTAFDGPLVIKEETGSAFRTNYFCDFHFIFLLPYKQFAGFRASAKRFRRHRAGAED